MITSEDINLRIIENIRQISSCLRDVILVDIKSCIENNERNVEILGRFGWEHRDKGFVGVQKDEDVKTNSKRNES